MTTAGRLLNELRRDSDALTQAVVHAAGIALERATATMSGGRLTLAEQLRLAEAAMLLAPRHARHAQTLRAQALAARNFENGDVERRLEAPAQRWERSAGMRG